jgi:hypothetical protein
MLIYSNAATCGFTGLAGLMVGRGVVAAVAMPYYYGLQAQS